MTNWQKQLTNLRQKQQLLYIMIFSLATAFIWVTISIFSSQKKTAIPAELQVLAKPLTPTINRQILTELQAKRAYGAAELQNFPIYKILVDKSGSNQKVTIDTPEPERSSSVRGLTLASPSPSPTPIVASDSGALATPTPTPEFSPSPIPTPTVEPNP